MIDLIILYLAIFLMVIFALKPIDWFLERMHKRHMEERQSYREYIGHMCGSREDE